MKRLFLLFTFLLTFGVASAQDEGLYVDAGTSLGTISPYIYGASYGPWALVSPEMAPLAAESGIKLWRFPAGNWGDLNDIRPDQLDLFMIQAQAWGAEISISTRVVNGTPEQSAELVRYANIEKGYNIRYWTIGNEPTLYEDYTIERFNTEWRAHAEAMLAVDPNIILVGPEVHQYPSTETYAAYLEEMRLWVRGFLEANGDMVDVVSIHRYPFPISTMSSATTDDLRLNAAETDTMIEILRADINEVMGRDLPIAITEMNSHYTNTGGGVASPDSFYNAIWWADVLGRFIEQKVDIVSYFALSASVTSGLGMLARYEPRPTYYTYLLYKQFGQELLTTTSPDNDTTIYAAKRDDGALTLIVVNLGPDERTLPLQIDDFTAAGDAEVWRLDAEHNAELLGEETLGDSLTLLGASVTLYVIPGE